MRLVATCFAAEAPELERRLCRAASRLRRTDLVEARLDRLARPPEPWELARFVRVTSGRLLATARAGGSGSPSTEPERVSLLERAARAGAAAVDVELGTAAESADLPERCERIVSHHEAEDAAPPSLERVATLVEKLRATGASSLKLAAPAGGAVTALRWMKAAREAAGCREMSPVPLGSTGRGLRLLAGRGLASLLYCSEGEPVAPGQPRLEDLLDVHAVRQADETAPLFAIVGWPLERTWSPLLHGALLRRAGRPGLMVPLPVEDAADVLPLLDELGVTRAAVTMPHKTSLVGRVDALSERAQRGASLNTLRRADAGWEAESFDGPAAFEALGGRAGLRGCTVALVGAGGAAAALGAELAAAETRVVVMARRDEAARELAERLGVEHAPLAELARLAPEVVVNATPAEPCEPLAMRVAFDMRTTPPDTDWLRRAAAGQLQVVDGLSMLARQAAAQQRWWGLPVEDMAVERLLRELARARGGEPT